MLSALHGITQSVGGQGEIDPVYPHWSPLVMVYRESITGHDETVVRWEIRSSGISCGTQLDYRRFDQKAGQLPSPPVLGQEKTCEERESEYHADPENYRGSVPTRVLIRSRTAQMVYAATGTLPVLGQDGLATVHVDETVFRPDLKRDTVVREELTYRVKEGIPVRFVTFIDGKEYKRFEVLELKFLPLDP
ncbi:MAG: hypothetical protein ACKVVP_05260 [Chloroflexota bacterium]